MFQQQSSHERCVHVITCACDHVCMRSRAHAVTCECSHYATLQHHTSFRQPESVWYIAPLISKMSPALQGKVRHCAFVCLSIFSYLSLLLSTSLLCLLSLSYALYLSFYCFSPFSVPLGLFSFLPYTPSHSHHPARSLGRQARYWR